MPQSSIWLAWAISIASAAWLTAGCNNQSNRMPFASTTAAATVAAGISAPVGPFPRGDASQAPPVDPATTGPKITILRPERGALSDAPSVMVEVQVEDVDGVAQVSIAGETVQSVGGTYRRLVSLDVGLNRVAVTATDALGNASSGYVSVTHGTFVADDQAAARSVHVSMSPTGLSRVADIASREAAKFDLAALIKQHNPLVDTSVAKISATDVRHQPMQVAIQGAPAGITARVSIDAVELDVEVDPIALAPIRGTAFATRATATIQATVDRNVVAPTAGPLARALGLKIERIDVALDGFRVQAASGFVNTVLSPFVGLIESAVRDALRDLLVDLADDLLAKSLAGLDQPLVVAVPVPLAPAPGELELMVQVDEARGFQAAGLGIVGGATIRARTPVAGTPDRVLSRDTQLRPQVVGNEPFAVQLTSDGVNLLAHALYRSGGLEVVIDGANPSPTATMALDCKLLFPFFPQVRALAPDPATPMRIEVSLQSAPIATFGRDPTAPLAIDAGEIQISILIDYMDGQPPLELVTVRVGATLSADLEVQPRHLRLKTLKASPLSVDVIREPAVDLADQELENFLVQIVPLVLDEYATKIPPIPIPALPFGLDLQSPRVTVDPDVLTVAGSL